MMGRFALPLTHAWSVACLSIAGDDDHTYHTIPALLSSFCKKNQSIYSCAPYDRAQNLKHHRHFLRSTAMWSVRLHIFSKPQAKKTVIRMARFSPSWWTQVSGIRP